MTKIFVVDGWDIIYVELITVFTSVFLLLLYFNFHLKMESLFFKHILLIEIFSNVNNDLKRKTRGFSNSLIFKSEKKFLSLIKNWERNEWKRKKQFRESQENWIHAKVYYTSIYLIENTIHKIYLSTSSVLLLHSVL